MYVINVNTSISENDGPIKIGGIAARNMSTNEINDEML